MRAGGMPKEVSFDIHCLLSLVVFSNVFDGLFSLKDGTNEQV